MAASFKASLRLNPTAIIKLESKSTACSKFDF